MYINTANRGILAIAWPMMLSSASVPLLGMVDTALLGHLDSERYLAAVAIGSMFISLVFWSFNFLRMGTTGLSAQALGRSKALSAIETVNRPGDSPESDAILLRAAAIATFLGLGLLLAVPWSLEYVLDWLQASDDIRPLADEYISIRRYSAPAVFVTMAISGYLIGSQHPRAALALVLTTNLGNIALDIWFIKGLGWGSAGAAWASVIAEHTGLVVALALAARYSKVFRFEKWRSWFRSSALLEMLRFNYHLLIRTLLLMLVFNFFTAQGAANGDSILAANAILLQLVLLSAFVLDGFAYAAEALCGEAYGARNQKKLFLTIKYCRNWIMGSTLLFVVAYLIFGEYIVAVFSDIEGVMAEGKRYLPWAILATGLGCVAYLMDGVYIGIGRSAAMHYSMWLASAGFLIAWYFSRAMDNHGLWLAYCCWVAMRGALLGIDLTFWKRRFLHELNTRTRIQTQSPETD